MLANKTFSSGNTIWKIRRMCLVFKLNGLKLEEISFLKARTFTAKNASVLDINSYLLKKIVCLTF